MKAHSIPPLLFGIAIGAAIVVLFGKNKPSKAAGVNPSEDELAQNKPQGKSNAVGAFGSIPSITPRQPYGKTKPKYIVYKCVKGDSAYTSLNPCPKNYTQTIL